mmetsp:Transcript_29320/g.91390  ORF Transcript_29320/g.91390 Transcript_29320/m.91390 type:complete len:94 (+) Transcript_29320:288-569(+)
MATSCFTRTVGGKIVVITAQFLHSFLTGCRDAMAVFPKIPLSKSRVPVNERCLVAFHNFPDVPSDPLLDSLPVVDPSNVAGHANDVLPWHSGK